MEMIAVITRIRKTDISLRPSSDSKLRSCPGSSKYSTAAAASHAASMLPANAGVVMCLSFTFVHIAFSPFAVASLSAVPTHVHIESTQDKPEL